MLNCLCNVVFCTVDSAFGNNISVDAVVVMGSFVPIEWLGMQLMRTGSFAYQTYQKYEKNCCLLSLLSGAVFGAVIAAFSTPISHIFALTDTQHKMLRDVLILYGSCMPMEAVSRFMMTYVTYKCMNRLNIVANFVTYILLIGTDWIAVKMNWGVFGLVASTEFTWLAYLVIVLIVSKFYRNNDKFSFDIIKKCIGHAKDLVIARGLGRVANIVFGHYLSLMGEFNYAIFAVCLNATSVSEEFRDASVDFCLVKLNGAEDKKQIHKRVLRQCFVPAVAIPVIASYLCLFFLHGKVALSDSIGYLIFFNLPVLIYPFYDTLFAYFMSVHNTRVTLIRGILNCVWRIPVAALVSYLGGGIVSFAMLYLFDYLTAIIVYGVIYTKGRKVYS